MKKLMRHFRYGEKGFTLIELLVVIAILGILAAIAVPNVGKFMGTGKSEAARTELHNIQTAVMADMADLEIGTVSNPPLNFGNTAQDTTTPTPTDADLDGDLVNDLGSFIVGGAASVQGDYDIAVDGTVTQAWYPGL